jgi:hypothetical protein
MPRIYDSSNDPLDFCKDCYPAENVAERKYGDTSKSGGPWKLLLHLCPMWSGPRLAGQLR